jgi:hypothetical protein
MYKFEQPLTYRRNNMSNKHLVKIGFFALIIVGVTVFSLAAVTDSSLAQGPGGGGNGNGRGGQGSPNAGQGSGQQNPGQGIGQQNGGQGFGGQQNAGQTGSCQYCLNNLPAAVPGEVPAEVVEALTAGFTDEHYAYDIYQSVIDQFGAVRPFTSIQQAEADHIAALEFILERYNLDVPEIAPLSEVPQFASLADACSAGAAAEIANFDLYDQWLATVQDYPDMVQVFTSLRDASEFQHLPAFERCAG